MKKLFIFISLFIVAMVIVTMTIAGDDRSEQQKFKEQLNRMQTLVYVDPDFGYSFEYPSFFDKEEIEEYGLGHVQYSYHGSNVNLVLECKVVPDSVIHSKVNDYIKEGEDQQFSDYRYYAHYFRKGKQVYILTLFYPTDYKDAIGRIIYDVKIWKPFYKSKLKPC